VNAVLIRSRAFSAGFASAVLRSAPSPAVSRPGSATVHDLDPLAHLVELALNPARQPADLPPHLRVLACLPARPVDHVLAHLLTPDGTERSHLAHHVRAQQPHRLVQAEAPVVDVERLPEPGREPRARVLRRPDRLLALQLHLHLQRGPQRVQLRLEPPPLASRDGGACPRAARRRAPTGVYAVPGVPRVQPPLNVTHAAA
jgi:hypothetical protein